MSAPCDDDEGVDWKSNRLARKINAINGDERFLLPKGQSRKHTDNHQECSSHRNRTIRFLDEPAAPPLIVSKISHARIRKRIAHGCVPGVAAWAAECFQDGTPDKASSMEVTEPYGLFQHLSHRTGEALSSGTLHPIFSSLHSILDLNRASSSAGSDDQESEPLPTAPEGLKKKGGILIMSHCARTMCAPGIIYI